MELASRGWSVALATTVVALSVILVVVEGASTTTILGVSVLALWAVFWVLGVRRTGQGGPLWIVVIVVTVLVSGVLTAIAPVMAVFQFLAYPLVWTVACSTLIAIVANIAVASSVAVGFLISLGTQPDDLIQTFVTQGISLTFSVIMGLWITRIAQLGNERKRLLDELTAAQDELAVLHRDSGATDERERLARELHDTLAQSLTGLTLLAQRARRELAAGAADDSTLELIESGTRDALAETRAVVAGSARVELGGGLPDALARLGERISRETGIDVTTVTRVDRTLDRDAEVVLLRCAQEGLANVRKHAGATRARVELEVGAMDATVRVIDDGRGFDADAPSTGFGLSGLRDRLGLVGGELSVAAGAAGAAGTTLTARLPLGASA